MRTPMRTNVVLDVCVVRGRWPRPCQACGKRRIVFGFGITLGVVENPDTEWKCAPCWGLRPERDVRHVPHVAHEEQASRELPSMSAEVADVRHD